MRLIIVLISCVALPLFAQTDHNYAVKFRLIDSTGSAVNLQEFEENYQLVVKSGSYSYHYHSDSLNRYDYDENTAFFQIVYPDSNWPNETYYLIKDLDTMSFNYRSLRRNEILLDSIHFTPGSYYFDLNGKLNPTSSEHDFNLFKTNKCYNNDLKSELDDGNWYMLSIKNPEVYSPDPSSLLPFNLDPVHIDAIPCGAESNRFKIDIADTNLTYNYCKYLIKSKAPIPHKFTNEYFSSYSGKELVPGTLLNFSYDLGYLDIKGANTSSIESYGTLSFGESREILNYELILFIGTCTGIRCFDPSYTSFDQSFDLKKLLNLNYDLGEGQAPILSAVLDLNHDQMNDYIIEFESEYYFILSEDRLNNRSYFLNNKSEIYEGY